MGNFGFHPGRKNASAGRLSSACLGIALAMQAPHAMAADRVNETVVQKTAVIAAPDRCAVQSLPQTPDIPGGDIFGILSPTDIGDACSFGFAAETTGRAGKRDGRYVATTTKFQFTYTYSDRLSFAVSPFVSAFSWKDVTVNRGILFFGRRRSTVQSEHRRFRRRVRGSELARAAALGQSAAGDHAVDRAALVSLRRWPAIPRTASRSS